MSDRFPGPGRDHVGWEIAWGMLERFGWRRIDYGPDVEAWENTDTGMVLVRDTRTADPGEGR